jgi:hypothetical protein
MTHGIAADRPPSAAFARRMEPPVKDGAGPAWGGRPRERDSRRKRECMGERANFFPYEKCYNSQIKTPN